MLPTRSQCIRRPRAPSHIAVSVCHRLSQVRGLVRQHIESYNYFLNVDMHNIVFADANKRVTLDQVATPQRL